jgi:putative transcriptional regulator
VSAGDSSWSVIRRDGAPASCLSLESEDMISATPEPARRAETNLPFADMAQPCHVDAKAMTGEAPMNNKLKVLRAMRNWSQAELADRLDVSRQAVNAIETGKYDPSLPLAFKLARLFDMPIEEIFDDGNEGHDDDK